MTGDLTLHYEELARHEVEREGWRAAGDVFADLQMANDPHSAFQIAVRGVAAHLQKQAGETFALGLSMCESPIEGLLLPWLLCQPYQCFEQNPQVLRAGEAHLLKPYTVAICPQYQIGRRRTDFALAARRAGPVRIVVIECDGREFHLDVHADVRRDAELLSHPRILDIHPISGADIWRDPKRAAASAARAHTNAWAKTNRAGDLKFSPETTRMLAQGSQL